MLPASQKKKKSVSPKDDLLFLVNGKKVQSLSLTYTPSCNTS